MADHDEEEVKVVKKKVVKKSVKTAIEENSKPKVSISADETTATGKKTVKVQIKVDSPATMSKPIEAKTPGGVAVVVKPVPLTHEERHAQLAAERAAKNKLAPKLVCGAIAGVIGTCSIFPLDMVKTRLQNQKAHPQTGVYPYRNALDCAQQIYRSGGGRGFYRGLASNLVGVIPEKALKLAVNDYLRVHLQGSREHIPLHYEIAAGAGAGFCQVVATTPMERVKLNLQIAGETPLQPGQKPVTGVSIVRSLGIRGLYKGTAATLLRDVPFSFIYFPLYAQMKHRWTPAGEKHPTLGVVMASGMAAGAFSSGLVTPCDVIKTRLQAIPKPGESLLYTGWMDCYQKIVQKEGHTALYRGAVPRMLIVSPLFGIALSVYEIQQMYFS